MVWLSGSEGSFLVLSRSSTPSFRRKPESRDESFNFEGEGNIGRAESSRASAKKRMTAHGMF